MTLAKEAGTSLCVHISIYLYEFLCVCIYFMPILAYQFY